MLKRNLLIIVAVGLGLLFSSSVIAQTGKAKTTKRKAKAGNRMEEVTFNYGNKTKANQRKAHSKYDLKNVMISYRRKPQKTKAKRANYQAGGIWVSGDPISTNKTRSKTNSRKKTKNQNLLPYVEQSNLRKKSKYANQEVSYRKNKSSNRNRKVK